MKQELSCWRDWHDYWVRKARDENFPVLFFRFEDLVSQPGEVLKEVFAFSLGVQSVQNTLVGKKIELFMRKKAEGTAKT